MRVLIIISYIMIRVRIYIHLHIYFGLLYDMLSWNSIFFITYRFKQSNFFRVYFCIFQYLRIYFYIDALL
jgi:hypothetical protein